MITLGLIAVPCPGCGREIAIRLEVVAEQLRSVGVQQVVARFVPDLIPLHEHFAQCPGRGPDGDDGEPLPIPTAA